MSLLVETDDVGPVERPCDVVGVDLGVKALAKLSTEETVDGPKSHKTALKRLQRTNKAVACLHPRIANIRKDATHKLTTRLAKTYRRIGMEDLNVRGISTNRSLARAVMDGCFFELRRQLEYRARLYGSLVVVADRWFASRRTCSCCSVVKSTLALSRRTFA